MFANMSRYISYANKAYSNRNMLKYITDQFEVIAYTL